MELIDHYTYTIAGAMFMKMFYLKRRSFEREQHTCEAFLEVPWTYQHVIQVTDACRRASHMRLAHMRATWALESSLCLGFNNFGLFSFASRETCLKYKFCVGQGLLWWQRHHHRWPHWSLLHWGCRQALRGLWLAGAKAAVLSGALYGEPFVRSWKCQRATLMWVLSARPSRQDHPPIQRNSRPFGTVICLTWRVWNG